MLGKRFFPLPIYWERKKQKISYLSILDLNCIRLQLLFQLSKIEAQIPRSKVLSSFCMYFLKHRYPANVLERLFNR
jgi:hypothetical protein